MKHVIKPFVLPDEVNDPPRSSEELASESGEQEEQEIDDAQEDSPWNSQDVHELSNAQDDEAMDSDSNSHVSQP